MRIRNLLMVKSPRVKIGLTHQRQKLSEPDISIEVEAIDYGPYSLEFSSEEVIAGPYILNAVIKAEKQGVDAVILECMLDPVIRAARELATIPVVGPAKASLAFASNIGSRIAIIGVANGQTVLEEHIKAYGMDNHIASYHVIDIPPGDLAEGQQYCLDVIISEAQSAIRIGRADVILFGCTAMSSYASELQRQLAIPVVEPAACAIRMAIDLVRMGLSHSKRCYPSPPERPVAKDCIQVREPTRILSSDD